MNEQVKSDFKELQETTPCADAVIIDDLGPAFGYHALKHAFRSGDGWRRADRATEESLLDARRRALARRRPVRRRDRVCRSPRRVRGRQTRQRFFEQVLASVGVDATATSTVATT